MKRIVFFIIISALATFSIVAEDDTQIRAIDTTFVFDPQEYIAVPWDAEGQRIGIRDAIWQTGKPALPYITTSLGIYEDETLEDYDCSFEDKVLLYENVDIAIFGSDESLSNDWPYDVSLGSISVISSLDKNLKGFWKKFSFHICPFEYDATYRKLYLYKKALLRVRMHKSTNSYIPFIDEGKEWITGQLETNSSPDSYSETCQSVSRIYFDGDTIVGGYHCARWMKQTTDLLSSGQPVETTLIAPIFEHDQQVFFFYPNETTPRLLYDFKDSSEEKDIVLYSIYDNTHLPYTFSRGKGSQQYDASNFPVSVRGYETTPDGFYSPGYDHSSGVICQLWIEGVGGEHSPDMNIYLSEDNYRHVTSKCLINGQRLCSLWNSDLTAIPSISSNTAKSSSSRHHFFDLSGRRLSAPPAKGVYIMDGKKVAGR